MVGERDSAASRETSRLPDSIRPSGLFCQVAFLKLPVCVSVLVCVCVSPCVCVCLCVRVVVCDWIINRVIDRACTVDSARLR